MEKSSSKSYCLRRLRLLVKRHYAIVLSSAILAGIFFYAVKVEPTLRRITRLEFADEQIPSELDGLKIAFAADLHVTYEGSNALSDIVQAINREQCDLILLGGDFINGNGRGPLMTTLMPTLEKLQAPLGVYAITGNHEYQRGIDAFKDAFANSHLRLLIDDRITLQLANGTSFNLIGLDYTANPHRRSDPQRMQELFSNKGFNITLCHTPEDFPFLPDNAHLTFSGHTHGGQLNLPLLGSIINHPGYGRKLSYGKVRDKNKTLFVTAGLGSAYTQARLFMRPEIMILTLKSTAKK